MGARYTDPKVPSSVLEIADSPWIFFDRALHSICLSNDANVVIVQLSAL